MAKLEDRTRLVHLEARSKTPKSRARQHEQSVLTRTEQRHVLLELVWHTGAFSNYGK